MTGRYLTDLADVCRAAGLSVIEHGGWQTRARSSGGYGNGLPWCVMWHHTASQTTPANDVSYIINASDGPLSNLYLARDGTVHVIAAGATNTNGKGGPLAMSKGVVPVDGMNTRAIGIEAANSGTGEPWPQPQIDAFFTLSNALCAAYGLQPTDIASHAAWSPSRKIDPARANVVQGPWQPRSINSSGTWSLDDMRHESTSRSASTPPEPEPEGELMYSILTDPEGNAFGGMRDAHGICNPITWLTPERYETCVRLGAPLVPVNRGDLAGCDLLGAMPPGYERGNFANVIA